MKFLKKLRRGGDEDQTDAKSEPQSEHSAPATSPTPELAATPESAPTPDPVIAPAPAAESSFVESSFDADPVDAPVTQPPMATFEVKTEKKGRKFGIQKFKFKKDSKDSKTTAPPEEEEKGKIRAPRFFKKKSQFVEQPAEKGKQHETVEIEMSQPIEFRYRKRREVNTEGERAEQIAMDTFQYRIHQSRASGYSQYGILKAPGFDYLNWRPYGYPRYTHSNPESYLQQIHALVPYVYDVVVSGCQGVEERRWDALTKSADSHAASAQATRDNSAMGSRTQSKDKLVD